MIGLNPSASEALGMASQLLGVDKQTLSNALCERVVQVGTETTVVHRTALSAQFARDALAKAVYVRVFNWLVQRINQAMQVETSDQSTTQRGPDNNHVEGGDDERKRGPRMVNARKTNGWSSSSVDTMNTAKKKNGWASSSMDSVNSVRSVENSAAFVGVLDIMGLESLQRNDFEQLLINATNSVLQVMM
jgi:myosin heavy subunit